MNGLDRFTCEEAFRRLGDYLDGELSPAELRLIEEHLEVCAACTREFAFERSILEGVRAKLRATSVPNELLDRVASLLAQAPGASRPSPDENA